MRRATDPGRRVAGLVAILLAAAMLAAAIPLPVVGSAVRSVVNWSADTADPHYVGSIVAADVRAAAARLPAGATYYVDAPDGVALSATEVNYFSQALLLFALPAVPVRRAIDADWVVAYRTEPSSGTLGRIRVGTTVTMARRR